MAPTSIRKHPIFLSLAIIFLSLVLLFAYSMAESRWPWVFDRSEVREANNVISAVESFRGKCSCLPETLAQIGIDEVECITESLPIKST